MFPLCLLKTYAVYIYFLNSIYVSFYVSVWVIPVVACYNIYNFYLSTLQFLLGNSASNTFPDSTIKYLEEVWNIS